MRKWNSKYDYSNAITLVDLLPDEDCERWEVCGRKMHRGKKARAIFGDFLAIMLDDIIENGNVYYAPIVEELRIYIQHQKRANVERILRNSSKIYKDVDLIKSDGKFYEFVLYSRSIPGKYRSIRINYKKYKQIIKKVNEGMRYVLWR